MNGFLEELAARRRFGMKPGLDAIRGICRALGDPQERFRAIHVAGTNGKGAVCAILDQTLRSAGFRVGRYTSPHLVRLNERFFLDGTPVADGVLQRCADSVWGAVSGVGDVTFFEALTAVAFLLYAEEKPDFAVLETGLGGRLDATNICRPVVSVITRIGLDHCEWLGDTVEKIAAEKAGIVKPGVPVVLGRNVPEVVDVVRLRAAEVGAPFFYAPDVASEAEVPEGFSLAGSFNRENAVTAVAALKVLGMVDRSGRIADNGALSTGIREGFAKVVWPGRFQRVGRFVVDGAHNPPAARALAAALLDALRLQKPLPLFTLVVGFCGDKDVEETLRVLAPFAKSAIAVRTNNPRSLEPAALVEKLRAVGIPARPAASLRDALSKLGAFFSSAAVEAAGGEAGCESWPQSGAPDVLVCGSLFLAGEALVELGAHPWPADRFDPSESLRKSR